MEVYVRLGPGLSQLAGVPRLTVTLEPGATVHDLLSHLRERYPALEAALGSSLPVVRGTSVAGDHPLAPDDEIAFLKPVSGGSAGR
ncbi:MoaD/ThiS family protein [Sphaerobacter sp.]|uniref:MoaD/ThiS family protein n=1 Tax=Sphaerobacter sp. TaxID=2099654 RepID=UPI001DE2F57E|nr:MoaD/ThiS family protein [Sphaerobacter sp.]MBX5443737.1 MoaD/ThiS family protein [Sphaerobacter sp.]